MTEKLIPTTSHPSLKNDGSRNKAGLCASDMNLWSRKLLHFIKIRKILGDSQRARAHTVYVGALGVIPTISCGTLSAKLLNYLPPKNKMDF